MYQYQNPYAVLGVSPTADLAEIKKAYRGLAKKHHPDLNPHDQRAVAFFREIQQAYDYILSVRSAMEQNQWQQPNAQTYYPPTYQPYQAPPQNQEFKSYAWESWEGEQLQPDPPAAPSPVVEDAPFYETVEEIPPPPVEWQENLLQVSLDEAFREAKNRAENKNLSVEENLEYEIQAYLQQDGLDQKKPQVKFRQQNKGILGFALGTARKTP